MEVLLNLYVLLCKRAFQSLVTTKTEDSFIVHMNLQ